MVMHIHSQIHAEKSGEYLVTFRAEDNRQFLVYVNAQTL